MFAVVVSPPLRDHRFDLCIFFEVITSLTKGGPADRAGVQDGDRLIEINGENVESKTHNEVVEIIREHIPKNEITFKLISEVNDKARRGSEKSSSK